MEGMNERKLIMTTLSAEELQELLRKELQAVLTEHIAIASQPETDQIGGIDLAQEITGLAKPTIYGLVAQSKIPCMKQGKKLYFSKHELTDWIKQGRRKTVADIEAETDSYLSAKSKRG